MIVRKLACLFLLFLLISPCLVLGQTQSGSVKGQVVAASSLSPLAGAKIKVSLGEYDFTTETDDQGMFRLSDIPVGRYDISFIATGFESVIRPEILVGSSKEVVLKIILHEKVFEMEEVELRPQKEKGTPINQMASVSAISFSVEETRKFAGGIDDPARLAANLPGVTANPFISDNLISIRGNSPRGMIYRLEGIDIPNPNHFARIGSSGGSFTLFSLQMLDNSDFFTGAFPAEYGNATSGVFDIKFRSGNREKREYAFQAGVLGFDFSAEGPFKKGKNASYLFNYRFFSFNLAKWLTNTTTVPTYQDLAFNIDLPTQKVGKFGIFGLGGQSERPKPALTEMSKWEYDIDRFENVLASDMGVLGFTHAKSIGTRSLWRTAIVGSSSMLRDNKRYLEDNLEFRQRDINEYYRQPFTFTTSLRHSFSPRHIHKSGIILTTTQHDYISRKYDYVEEKLFTRAEEAGRTQTLQAYSQSRFIVNDRLSLNMGIHLLYFDLTQVVSPEPRLGLNYRLGRNHSVGLGYGLHSRIEHFATYMTRLERETGSVSLPNLNLDLLKSQHFVLNYRASFSENMKFRAEAYLQKLKNVPVEIQGTYSVINLDELNELRILDNLGKGMNYGLDLGLERFTLNGLYFMANASVYNSTYTDASGMVHSTAFNNGFKVNLLGGKELKLGKKKGLNKLLGINGTLTAIGGERYTPIDLDASRNARETIPDESLPYVFQEVPLYILDLTVTLRNNKSRYAGIWALQIKNMLQSTAPEYREYDAFHDQLVTLRGASILPVISYKIEF